MEEIPSSGGHGHGLQTLDLAVDVEALLAFDLLAAQEQVQVGAVRHHLPPPLGASQMLQVRHFRQQPVSLVQPAVGVTRKKF